MCTIYGNVFDIFDQIGERIITRYLHVNDQ